MKYDKAELIRLKHLYKKLVMEGKIKLPFEQAVKFIGPDTAYHLYENRKGNRSTKNASKKKRRTKK